MVAARFAVENITKCLQGVVEVFVCKTWSVSLAAQIKLNACT